MKRMIAVALGSTALMGAWDARAESFVHPLATVPSPNAVVLFDTSVTMGINPGCTGCHARGEISEAQTRLNIAKEDILGTMPMFREYFVFGGVEYSGCGSAKIEARILPTPTDPDDSYEAVIDMIEAAEYCRSRENFFPGGAMAPTNCLLPYPGPGCSPDDVDRALSLVGPPLGTTTAGLPGFNIPTAPAATSTVCNAAAAPWPNYDLQAVLIGRWATGAFTWPRWTPETVNAARVQNELCEPIGGVLEDIRSDLAACLVNPDAFWNLDFLDLGFGGWCNPGTIAGSACESGSPFDGTCVCNQDDPNCLNGALVPVSECNGLPLTWKARQQVAICETYDRDQDNDDPQRTFGEYFRDQPDNVVNTMVIDGETVRGCRENVSMYFTDGYMGDAAGVPIQANAALTAYRSPDSGASNMFVFQISESFNDAANALADSLSVGALPTAYSATDEDVMQASFAQVLSRVFKGVYTGAPAAVDTYETRVAIHSFAVPGYNEPPSPITDTYLGWPARISWHAIDSSGEVVAEPIFETDWQSRITSVSNICAGAQPATPYVLNPGSIPNLDQLFGPPPRAGSPTTPFGNGIQRRVTVGAGRVIDRDGDGELTEADTHPALRLGYMFSRGSTRPVIVAGPREAQDEASAAPFSDFTRTNISGGRTVRERPRMIYSYSNGYVHGFHAGRFLDTPVSFGDQRLAFDYDDDPATSPAGREVFRYAPRWITDNTGVNYDYTRNNLVQQPVTTGQLIAREVYVDRTNLTSAIGGVTLPAGDQVYRTFLIGNQGREGRGFFSLDITDPCDARPVAEWRLPTNERASATPEVYTFPMPTGQRLRPVVITTGGLEGAPNIRVFDIVTGNNVAMRALPAPGGASYATGAVCLDADGQGHVTACYALRTDGALIRVPVLSTGTFGAPEDITPAGVIGGGRVFATRPAVYFGADGAINIVFGSGDYRNITSADATENYIYKVVDRSNRLATSPAVADIDNVCYPATADPTSTGGRIRLGAGERVLSPPVVAKGVVAWTTYISESTGCVAGSARVYAMNYMTCQDALSDGNSRPEAQDIGDGIPSEPVLLRSTENLLVQTSADPVAGEVAGLPVDTKGGDTAGLMKLYWRPKSGTY